MMAIKNKIKCNKNNLYNLRVAAFSIESFVVLEMRTAQSAPSYTNSSSFSIL